MENNEEQHVDSQEESKEFSFLQETIKAEPVNKKKVVHRFLLIAIRGLVFGMCASIGFFAFKPWVESQFHGKSSIVKIPKDDEEVIEDEGTVVEAGQEVNQPIERTLDVENYKELYNSLSQVTAQAKRSIVTVKGILGSEAWKETQFNSNDNAAGVIIANTGVELLMLTESSILKEADSISITFDDGNEYAGTLKKKDENIGMAVISVPKSSLTEGTLNHIETAILGNSNAMFQGNPVIAIGNPFGYVGGMGYGIISSNKNVIPYIDGEYRILTTDMPASATGTGVLINLNGEVVGIISPKMSKEENMSVVTALSISDMKIIIELLSNGSGVPYIGIQGNEITQKVIDAQGLPRGLYVKEVAADSPGMVAGIQSGDILTSIEDATITTVGTYKTALLDLKVGQDIKIKGLRLGANGYVDIEYKIVIGSHE